MLLLFGLLLFLAVASMVLLMPGLWGRTIYNQYRGSRAVACPETGRQVAVDFDAFHAAVTGLGGQRDVRLRDCTRWPTRRNCGQACIPEALLTKPYTRGEINVKTKKIYHLPVLLAASASWYLGAVWHSEYLFRGQWMAALGLNRTQELTIAEWWTPHLLSIGICLLFAYGVAWLQALRGRKGLWQGILTAVLLWGAVTAVGLLGADLSSIPGNLLRIEMVYTFLAALVIGATIGGLTGMMEAPVPE